jgi:hypothetical protein
MGPRLHNRGYDQLADALDDGKLASMGPRLRPDIQALPELSTDYIPRALGLIGHLVASIQVCYMEETTDFDSGDARNSAAKLIELLKRSSDPSSRQAASPS